jgi:hypothetical protein
LDSNGVSFVHRPLTTISGSRIARRAISTLMRIVAPGTTTTTVSFGAKPMRLNRRRTSPGGKSISANVPLSLVRR